MGQDRAQNAPERAQLDWDLSRGRPYGVRRPPALTFVFAFMVVSSFPSKFRSLDNAQNAPERAQLDWDLSRGRPYGVRRPPAFTFVFAFMVVSSFPSKFRYLIMRKMHPKELSLIRTCRAA